MDLIRQFIRNPVKVAVGVIFVVLFGVIAMLRMPVQLTPEVEVPTITIETRWPGASPQEVEREIVNEQEEQLRGVEGTTKLSSESMDGMGRISLEFPVGTNMQDALVRVNARLSQVTSYPENAKEPVISTANLSNRPIAWFILREKPPSPELLRELEEKFPRHKAKMERIIAADRLGLKLRLTKELAADDPEVAAALPTAIDVPRLRKFAEDFVEARLERVDGVSNANTLGGEEEEMQVTVDPQRLAARQLTILDVRRALREQNRDTSGGDFQEGKRRYVVRTLGQFRSPAQVENVIIARRGDVPVYVRDVGTVQRGFKKPDGQVRNFGNAAIALNCIRQTGANVLTVMTDIKKAVAELNESLLERRGLVLEQVYDETEYILSARAVVTENIWSGALLTFVTLLIFIRSARSTLVIAAHIAVSTIGAFLIMSVLGQTLNVPSLGGLAFAVGMLVDNAIVMLENIYRRHQLGEDPETASVKGAGEVWAAILNSSLANLAIFLPVLFVKEEAGQLFRDIAIAISGAVGLSVLVAVAVVPTVAARILKPHPKRRENDDSSPATAADSPARVGQASKPAGFERDGSTPTSSSSETSAPTSAPHPSSAAASSEARPDESWLTRTLDRVLAPLDFLGNRFVDSVVGLNRTLQRSWPKQLATSLVLVVLTALVFWLTVPKVEYLPTGNRNLVIAILLPPPGYNLDKINQIGDQIVRELRPYWDINLDDPAAKKLKYPAIRDFFYVARGRQLFLGIRSADPLRARETIPLIQEVTSKIEGAFAFATQASLFDQSLIGGTRIDIEITGPELSKLIQTGGRVMGMVAESLPGAQALPRPSLDLSSPEVHVTPRWERSADMGMSAVDVGYTVDALVDGAYASDYFIGGVKVDLTLMGKEQYARHTQDLENLPIAVPTGELVPLAALADVRLASGPEQINRRERLRNITIQVNPPRTMPLEEAIEIVKAKIVKPLIDQNALGPEYQITLAGSAEKLSATIDALKWNFLLAGLITYLLMAALFESWLYPLIVITSVPLGAVGGVLGLWLLNLCGIEQKLDVLTMLGFIILVGTVVNNPILIVEQALNHIREDGMPYGEAILESLRTRIRPIFMTTLSGLIGLFPLVISPGAGAELYRGIGAVLLGGLLVSTIFTLVLVPTLFHLCLRVQTGLRRTPIRPES